MNDNIIGKKLDEIKELLDIDESNENNVVECTDDKEIFELTITADEVFSTDETFTMDNIGAGNKFKPIDTSFIGADGRVIKRNRAKRENEISNMTLPRIACQIYEKQIIALSDNEKLNFPICRYTLNGEVICGIFPSIDKFKQYKNTIEYLIYKCEDGSQFVIYCWNIFSTIIFVQECLKRFGNPGDCFKLIYREKDENIEDDNFDEEWIIVYDEFKTDKTRNRIVFGAPGTGKSYTLEKDRKEWLSDEDYFERVTFHPDYSYANFVGTYKPVPKGEGITYKYVPGPFARTLVKALENPQKPALLIIEEINRAQIASVFGDVFQLLDRDSKGISEYAIATSEDMRKYLVEELNVNVSQLQEIRIPSNMFIWASMNSADQGVFPMDTAFKRRWDFDYIGIDDEIDELPDTAIAKKWNTWRMAINKYLSSKKVNEDKLMGPFFIAKSVMDKNNESDFDRIFKTKVLMYLFEDAGKRCVDLFSGCNDDERKRYSLICDKFDEIGIKIFDKSIWEGIEN